MARRRLVAQADVADRQMGGMVAVECFRGRRIVIAGDPQPVASGLHRAQRPHVVRQQAGGGGTVVETVAERHHTARVETLHHRGKPAQRGGRVVRRQEDAARGVGGAFLEVQVGHDQHVLVRPVKRAGRIGHEGRPVQAEDFFAGFELQGGRVHRVF